MTNQKAAFGKKEGLALQLTNQKAAFGKKEGLALELTDQKAVFGGPPLPLLFLRRLELGGVAFLLFAVRKNVAHADADVLQSGREKDVKHIIITRGIARIGNARSFYK